MQCEVRVVKCYSFPNTKIGTILAHMREVAEKALENDTM